MTQSEQHEMDQLREQLSVAQASAEQVKGYFMSATDRLKSELRLYRGLFWFMLTFATAAAILILLQR